MPITPLIFARQMFGGPEFAGERAHQEEGVLRGRFVQDVSGIGERDFVLVGIGSVDVVKTDGVLCDNFERAFPGGEHLGINRIAQRGDQAIHTRLYLLDDQAFWWSFRLGIDFDLASLAVKDIKGVSNIAGGKNAEFLAHGRRSVYRIDRGGARVGEAKVSPRETLCTLWLRKAFTTQ